MFHLITIGSQCVPSVMCLKCEQDWAGTKLLGCNMRSDPPKTLNLATGFAIGYISLSWKRPVWHLVEPPVVFFLPHWWGVTMRTCKLHTLHVCLHRKMPGRWCWLMVKLVQHYARASAGSKCDPSKTFQVTERFTTAHRSLDRTQVETQKAELKSPRHPAEGRFTRVTGFSHRLRSLPLLRCCHDFDIIVKIHWNWFDQTITRL